MATIVPQTKYETYLTSAISSAVTTIPVATCPATGVTSGYVMIDDEIIKFEGNSNPGGAGNLTSCTRGLALSGSTETDAGLGAAHPAGSAVKMTDVHYYYVGNIGTSLDSLTDVVITAAASGDILRHNGTNWVDYPDSNYAASSHTHLLAAGATDVTASVTEINYVDGVTSAIQTQLGNKAPTASPTFSGVVTIPTPFTLGAVSVTPTGTELNFVDGVTSAIQTQLDAKLPLAGGTMSGPITLGENTSVALDPAGSADGKYTGITVTGTGGATIAIGDLITLDKDDSRWELVDISVAAAATGDARGILGLAVTTSSDGAAVTILLHGILRSTVFPTLTIGAPVYASTTGDVVVTQPVTTDHVIRIIGFGLTAGEMYFNPDNHYTTHI